MVEEQYRVILTFDFSAVLNTLFFIVTVIVGVAVIIWNNHTRHQNNVKLKDERISAINRDQAVQVGTSPGISTIRAPNHRKPLQPGGIQQNRQCKSGVELRPPPNHGKVRTTRPHRQRNLQIPHHNRPFWSFLSTDRQNGRKEVHTKRPRPGNKQHPVQNPNTGGTPRSGNRHEEGTFIQLCDLEVVRGFDCFSPNGGTNSTECANAMQQREGNNQTPSPAPSAQSGLPS